MSNNLSARFFSRKLLIECSQRFLRSLDLIIQNHLHNIFGNTEHLVGCQTNIQLILLNIGLQVIHLRHQFQRHILLVRHHVFSVGDMILPLLIYHGGHNIQNQFFTFRVIHTLVRGCNLEGWIGQIPVILLCLTKIRQQQHLILSTTRERDDIRTSAAEHGSFALAKHFLWCSVRIGGILCPQTGLLFKIKEILKDWQPYFFGKFFCSTALILLAPLTTLHTLKHWNRSPLQNLHAGIISRKIRHETTNTLLLKGFTSSNKTFVVCRNWHIVLIKQGFVDDNAIHLRAGREPIH